jgi:glycosyltransferase involved in cell wall biosynthesis
VRTGAGPGPERGSQSEAALLVPPRDPEALERAVSRVLDDPALAVRLAAAAARQASSLPSESDAVDQLAGIYLRLASPGRR